MNSITILAVSAITIVFAMLSTSAQADAAIFVKISGIEGDVTRAGYGPEKWFVADSFSFGVEREMKESGEKGGTEDINIGVGELQECTISKSMDSASAKLAQFAINGNSLETAEIHFVEVGSDGTEMGEPYLVYKLERVFVTSWQTSTDSDPETQDVPIEEVSLNYGKIAFGTNSDESTEPDPENDNIMTWDLKKNRPWFDIIGDIIDVLFPPPGSPTGGS